MNTLFKILQTLLCRIRYPISLPEDIADSLGITLSNQLRFQEFVKALSGPETFPTRLCRFMPRELAEKAFKKALRFEQFSEKTLISYCFQEGWLEFTLNFDREERLRRIYITHCLINEERGIEIPLKNSLFAKEIAD